MSESNRSRRATNWSKNECLALLEAVKPHSNILQQQQSDRRTALKKIEKWIEITAAVCIIIMFYHHPFNAPQPWQDYIIGNA